MRGICRWRGWWVLVDFLGAMIVVLMNRRESRGRRNLGGRAQFIAGGGLKPWNCSGIWFVLQTYQCLRCPVQYKLVSKLDIASILTIMVDFFDIVALKKSHDIKIGSWTRPSRKITLSKSQPPQSSKYNNPRKQAVKRRIESGMFLDLTMW